MDIKHTAGKWELLQDAQPNRMQNVIINQCKVVFRKGNVDCVIVDTNESCYVGIPTKERIANAKLIAEAGTVANETGFTPRQLVDQKVEILEALIGLKRDFSEVLGEYDIEPSMAGYMAVADEVIKKEMDLST